MGKSKQKRQLKRQWREAAEPQPSKRQKQQRGDEAEGNEMAVEIETLDFEDAFSAGLAFEQLESYDGALAAFQTAVKRQPSHLGALTHLADVHAAADQPDEALRCYKQASEFADGKQDASVWFRLGLAHAALEQHKEATKAYNTALEISAKALEAVEEDEQDPAELWKAYGVTLAALAEAFGELGDLDAAVQVFEAATKRFPSKANLFYNLANMRMARSGSVGNGDAFDPEVVRCLELAVQLDSDTREFPEDLAGYLEQHSRQPDRVLELKEKIKALQAIEAANSSVETSQAKGESEEKQESGSEDDDEEEESEEDE
ncbi:hypothetical protein BBJ28_00025358 [Nothophytophthora sp. Chile5]|nr:hypothetical protein BBJ28_00025358 [Nothophytophthora sp. Chile5]